MKRFYKVENIQFLSEFLRAASSNYGLYVSQIFRKSIVKGGITG